MPHNALPPAIRPTALRRRLDHLGIGLAGLCALHCAATLVVISTLGLGGHFLLDENIHRFGLLFAVIVAGAAIGAGTTRHRRRLPFATALVGLVTMAAALVIPHGVDEFLLTLVGVGLVSAGHLANLRAGR
jgi:hypothetical protein